MANVNQNIKLLNDFNLLLIDDPSTAEHYQPSDYDLAVQFQNNNSVRDQHHNPFYLTISIQQFRIFGSGIYMLFKFLQQACVVFAGVSILAIINIVLNTISNNLQANKNPPTTNISYQNFQTILTMTTLANLDPNKLTASIILNYIIILCLTLMTIYWKQLQKHHIIKCSQRCTMTSYFTVILKHIPNQYSQRDMIIHLSQFGDISQIFTIKKLSDDLRLYTTIADIIHKYRIESAMTKLGKQNINHYRNMLKLFFNYHKQYNEISQYINNDNKYSPVFAFITFKTILARQTLLQTYDLLNYSCFKQKKQQQQCQEDLYLGHTLLEFEECRIEPNGITWENIDISYKEFVCRTLLYLLMLLVVLTITIAVLFALTVIGNTLVDHQYDGLTELQAQIIGRQALKTYCFSLSFSSFQSQPICTQFTNNYLIFLLLSISVPILLSIFQTLLTDLMLTLAYFRKHPYFIQQLQSQILIMFASYFFAAGILPLLISMQAAGGIPISFHTIFIPMLQWLAGFLPIYPNRMVLFNDFEQGWYVSSTKNVVLVAVLSFNLSSITKVMFSIFRQKLYKYIAKKQPLQYEMNNWLQRQPLQLQFIYATALTIISFALLFGPIIPIIWPCSCLSLTLLYWANKYRFIRFCNKPIVFSHTINTLAIKIVLVSLIASCLMTPIFYGADTICTAQHSLPFFERILYYGYFLALAIAIFCYLVFRKMFMNLYKKYRAMKESDEGIDRRISKIPTAISTRTNGNQKLQSYSMHSNISYKAILKTLYTINTTQSARKTFNFNDDLRTVRSYQSPKNCNQLFKLISICKLLYNNNGGITNRYNPFATQLTLLKKLFKVYQQDNSIDRNNVKRDAIKGKQSLCHRYIQDIDFDEKDHDYVMQPHTENQFHNKIIKLQLKRNYSKKATQTTKHDKQKDRQHPLSKKWNSLKLSSNIKTGLNNNPAQGVTTLQSDDRTNQDDL